MSRSLRDALAIASLARCARDGSPLPDLGRACARRPGAGAARRGGFRGVGGGAPAWTPASLPGAYAIYDTRYGVTTATGVSNITSRVPGGPDRSQATAGLQPILHPRYADLGNKPAMLFDGATLYRLEGGAASDWNAFHGSGDYTIVHFGYLAGSGFRAFCATSQGTAANIGFAWVVNTGGNQQYYVTNGSVSENETGPATAAGSARFTAVRKSGTSIVMDVDGTEGAATTLALTPTGSDAGAAMRWGTAITPAGVASLPFNGASCYLGFFKRALTDAEIARVRAWLLAQFDPWRIMWCGDSTTSGSAGLVGGMRLDAQDVLIAAGVPFRSVGPSADGFSEGGFLVDGRHYGIGGVTQASRLGGVLTAVQATYTPDVLVLAYGVNDIGGATRTGAQALADTETLIGEIIAQDATARIVVRDCLRLAGYPAYAAYESERAAYNAGIDALVAAQVALGRRVAAWHLTSDPTTSDGLHPDDTATGYPSMAASAAAAIQSVL
jgi:lysophospholipase L1-like esterase